jgi:hypothetical protein
MEYVVIGWSTTVRFPAAPEFLPWPTLIKWVRPSLQFIRYRHWTPSYAKIKNARVLDNNFPRSLHDTVQRQVTVHQRTQRPAERGTLSENLQTTSQPHCCKATNNATRSAVLSSAFSKNSLYNRTYILNSSMKGKQMAFDLHSHFRFIKNQEETVVYWRTN